MVNNMVVDNELGEREVTVLPLLKKIWHGLKKGRFTPSKWLQTDPVILNTARWCGAYLCGKGNGWSVDVVNRKGEIVETFFSKEMKNARSTLQHVEWDVNVENDRRELLGIRRIGSYGKVNLTGEMTTAYGSHDINHDLSDISTVDAYSFEFESLVGSHPTNYERKRRILKRESAGIGLVHSVLLAKHLGVKKLQAIRWHYNRLLHRTVLELGIYLDPETI